MLSPWQAESRGPKTMSHMLSSSSDGIISVDEVEEEGEDPELSAKAVGMAVTGSGIPFQHLEQSLDHLTS